MRGIEATAVEPSADTSRGRRASRTARALRHGTPPRRRRGATARAGSTSRRRALDPGQRPVERQEHARAVPRDAVGGPRAAVGNRGEPGERAIDELARRASVRVRDETDAAGVAFEGPIVEERRGSQDLRLSGRGTYVGTSLPPVCLSASPAEAGSRRLAAGRGDDRGRGNTRRGVATFAAASSKIDRRRRIAAPQGRTTTPLPAKGPCTALPTPRQPPPGAPPRPCCHLSRDPSRVGVGHAPGVRLREAIRVELREPPPHVHRAGTRIHSERTWPHPELACPRPRSRLGVDNPSAATLGSHALPRRRRMRDTPSRYRPASASSSFRFSPDGEIGAHAPIDGTHADRDHTRVRPEGASSERSTTVGLPSPTPRPR